MKFEILQNMYHSFNCIFRVKFNDSIIKITIFSPSFQNQTINVESIISTA